MGIRDDGQIGGLPEKPAECRAKLTDLVRDLVKPSPDVQIKVDRHSGKTLALIDVAPGNGTVYALTVSTNKPEFYVRRNATTYYAQPDEIASIVRRGIMLHQQSGWPIA